MLVLNLELLDASIGAPRAAALEQIPAPAVISTATFAFEILPAYCNLNGVMHGGAAGVIFDMATTSARPDRTARLLGVE